MWQNVASANFTSAQSSLTYSEHANNFTDVQKGCTKLTNEWMKTSLACSDTSKLTFVQSELVLIESWWNEDSSVHIHVRISVIHSAIQWQKEATLGNYISRKWANCVLHVHWHQCNIIISWLRYLSAGWVFLLQTRNGIRIGLVQSKNITFSDLGDLSVASFCQNKAAFLLTLTWSEWWGVWCGRPYTWAGGPRWPGGRRGPFQTWAHPRWLSQIHQSGPQHNCRAIDNEKET